MNLYCKTLDECYKALALASVRFTDYEYAIFRDASENSGGILISKGWFYR